jgi:hypothetical protein
MGNTPLTNNRRSTDLDVLLASADYLPETIRRLATLGYEREGDLGITGRGAFSTPPDLFAHHLYVCLPNCEELVGLQLGSSSLILLPGLIGWKVRVLHRCKSMLPSEM